MVSITCQNFKPIHAVKLPSRKIDNIFGKNSTVEDYAKQREAEQAKLNKEIKESKLKREL
jgi:predicted outer membrane protein